MERSALSIADPAYECCNERRALLMASVRYGFFGPGFAGSACRVITGRSCRFLDADGYGKADRHCRIWRLMFGACLLGAMVAYCVHGGRCAGTATWPGMVSTIYVRAHTLDASADTASSTSALPGDQAKNGHMVAARGAWHILPQTLDPDGARHCNDACVFLFPFAAIVIMWQ